MIEIKEFAKHLADFTVFDCAVCSPDLFYFIAFDQRCRYNHDKRLIACHRADGNAMPQWSSTPLTAWDSTTLAYSPEEGACLAAFCRSVHVQGSAGSGWEDDIPLDDTQKIGCRGGIERLKEIDGALYACGSARTVGVRRGAGQWQWILADLPVMDADDDSSFGGTFEDIDGFSSKDIYVVGGNNDVWQYDGDRWQRVDFPQRTSGKLEAVCCGGDGNVYIAATGDDGNFFYGREGAWITVKFKSRLTLDVQDMVWFDGRLWLSGSGAGGNVWWVENDRLVKADVPSDVLGNCVDDFLAASVRLSVRNGVLLLAGKYGAAYRQGGAWHLLFNYRKMLGLAEKQHLLNEPEKAPEPSVVLSNFQVGSGPAYSYGPAEKEFFVDECLAISSALEEGKLILEDMVKTVLDDPALPQLNSLVFGAFWGEEPPQAFIDGLTANADRLQHIHSLYFGRFNDLCGSEAEVLGDYAGLLDALPNLRALVLKGTGTLNLGILRHSGLRHLEIISSDLSEGTLERLAHANLPHLETLIIYVYAQPVEALQPLMSRDRFPALTTLGFVNSDRQGELAKAVVESDLAPGLETVYFCYGTGLDDATGQYLLKHSGTLGSIKQLHLQFNNFDDATLNGLLALPFGVDVSLPQRDYEWCYPVYFCEEVIPNLRESEVDWLQHHPNSIYGAVR